MNLFKKKEKYITLNLTASIKSKTNLREPQRKTCAWLCRLAQRFFYCPSDINNTYNKRMHKINEILK